MKKRNFILIEGIILFVMGLITFIEVYWFGIFETVFNYIQTPSAWFVGLSLGFAFSSLFQKGLFSIFIKKFSKKENNKEDFFVGFLLTLIFGSLLTPYIKGMAVYFFENIFIYFHVILMQSIIIVYLLFKLKNDYEIPARYFISNELIVLINTILILMLVN
jgi:hypothetical protein